MPGARVRLARFFCFDVCPRGHARVASTYPVSALAPGRAPGEVTVEIDRKDLAAGKDRPVALWLRQYDPNAFVQERCFIYASDLLSKALTTDRADLPAKSKTWCSTSVAAACVT